MKQRTLILISTLCTLLGVGAAHAEDSGDRFGKLDRNGDGTLSSLEFESHALSRFAQADLNHDGKVSTEERNLQHEGHRRERFARDDLNHDGVLDRTEVERMPRAVFAKIDTDKSGGLNPKELTAFAKGKHGEEGAPLDSDGDGALNQAELRAMIRTKFAKLDVNRDGRLEREELDNDEHGCSIGGE